MNFYQRANLSLGLAVILGLELSITTWINNNSIDGIESGMSLLDESLWIAFQFLFRIKVAIDDHNHFSSDNDLGGSNMLIDFLCFSVSNFLFIIAAVFSFEWLVSSVFFSLGLVVASVWLFVHKSDNKRLWFVFNVVYVLLLVVLNVADSVEWVICSLLLAALVVDFMVSKTAQNMPSQ